MKKLILSILIMMSLMLMVVSVSGSNSPVEDAIIVGADRLVATQNNDGGWEWMNPDLDKDDGTTSTNIIGVIAQGLLDAYRLTNDEAYLNSAIKAYDYALSKVPEYTGTEESIKGVDSCPDFTFLVELSEIIGVDTYANLAKERYDAKKTSVGGATQWAQKIRDDRKSQGYPAIIPWDIDLCADGALALHSYYGGYDADANAMVDVIYDFMYVEDPGFNLTDTTQEEYWLSHTGTIEAFATTGLHTTERDALKTDLINSQDEDGHFVGVGDGSDAQTTAYAIMALLKVNEKEVVLDAVNYLVDVQLGTGGWSYPGENTEVTSEAVQALFDFGDVDGPIFGETSIEPTYPNCEDTLITINSDITDESGVAFAELFWRYDGGNENYIAPQFEDGLWITKIYIESEDEREITYQIKAIDNVGNDEWSSSNYEHLFTYDCLPPETTLTIGEPNYENTYITSNTKISLTCDDVISGCNKTYFKVDEDEWTEYTEPLYAPEDAEDGLYTISYYSVDNAGNSEEPNTMEVILDNTAPDITLEEQPEFYNTVPIVLNFTITDGGSRIDDYSIMRHKVGQEEGIYGDIKDECIVLNEIEIEEGVNLQVICEWDDGKKDGKFFFYVNAIDKVGNEGKSNVVETVLDRQSPLAPKLELPENLYITNNVNVFFNWVAEDDDSNLFEDREEGMSGIADSTIQIASDSEFNNIVEEETINDSYSPTLGEGEYYWRVRANDKAGNVGEWSEERTFTIDVTLPEILDVDVNPYEGSVYVAGTITASATVTDSNGVNSVTFNLSEEVCDATPVGNLWSCSLNTIPLEDGEYTLIVTAVDVAENEKIDDSLVVNVDNIGPETTVESPTPSSWFSADFNVVFSDTDAGVGELAICYYKINNGDLKERNCGEIAPVTVGEQEDCSVEGEDTCKIEAWAVDSLENIGNPVEVIYSIDWTWPPEIVSSSPSGEVTTDSPPLEIVTNKWATCKYDEQSKSFEKMANNMTSEDGINHEVDLVGLEEGMHVYYVRCQDEAENKMLSSEIIVFTVDTSGNYNLVIDLNSGWGFFFLPQIILETINSLNGNYSVQNVLASIEGSYIEIMYRYDDEEGWKSYVPGREVNDLTEFDDTENSPYWIKMTQADRLELV